MSSRLRKVGQIALRDFVATAVTRGFIIGLLITPAFITLFVLVGPRLFSQRNFKAQGQIAVIDPTSVVTPALRDEVNPELIAERRRQNLERNLSQVPAGMRQLAQSGAPGALDAAFGQIPDLRIVERPSAADVQQEKEWLRQAEPGAERHLALVVVHADAVMRPPGGQYGGYDLYEAPNLDDRVDAAIQQSVRQAIVAARARAQNLDRAQIDDVLAVERPPATVVTSEGERPSAGGLNRLMPVVFMVLLFMGVMMGGQTLMTSTIEEKSSRVVEVLLSAVSPIELMAGKILGQMAVGLIAIALYVVMGLALLLSFAMLGLIDLWLLAYLGIFFVLAYLTMGSIMAAIGAAVNELKEAQSMMGPLMLLMVGPMALAAPISQNPNSMFSTVISFVPPINTFAMLIRMTSSAPPPLWQVWLSIAVGAVAAVGAVWFAAKVFRIGLLMYGKPPDFATLVRWARSA